MASTTFWAPVHRLLARMAPGAAGFPLNAAPSLDYLGNGIQDHRLPYNVINSSAGAGALGFYDAGPTMVLNQVPAALGAAKIAALANAVSGVAMVLAGATAGITLVPANTLLLPSQVTISAGLVLDGLPALKRFGLSGNFVSAFYDRATMAGRAVSITGVVSTAGGNFLVSGYDVYGYAMSELITAAAGVATTNGKKAFKIVTSVVPQFTDAHTYSVGTTDIFGLPIRCDTFGEALIHWNSALITANTGFVAADTTSPATTTTGDVRGTYAVQSASDATKRLVARVSPTLSGVQSNPTTGLFGVGQT